MQPCGHQILFIIWLKSALRFITITRLKTQNTSFTLWSNSVGGWGMIKTNSSRDHQFSYRLSSVPTQYINHLIVNYLRKHIFSCNQAALWMVQSVRLTVTPFSLCSHHRIIKKFSGVITIDRSDIHAKVQGQRSKVKVTEVKTQLCRFRTVTPVWIHLWRWNDAQSLM